MLETVQGWAEWLWPHIVVAWPWLRSVLIGYAVSIGLTQVFKFYIPGKITDEQHRKRTRLLSATLAAVFIFLTWPNGDAWLWALALGPLCPIVVKAGLLLIYKRYPELEQKLSARPQ